MNKQPPGKIALRAHAKLAEEFKQAARDGKADGWTIRVASLSGNGTWTVTVTDSRAEGRFVKVKGKQKMFGRPRWVGVADALVIARPKPTEAA